MTFSEALGAAIRARRKGAKLRLKNVADKSGVSISYLSTVERGESAASVHTYRRVAGALGLTLSALMAEAEQALEPRQETPE